MRFESWEGIDLERMRDLIESSFGRTLVPDYFERTKPFRIYVSENYRAAMILTMEGRACPTWTSSPCSTMRRARAWAARCGR